MTRHLKAISTVIATLSLLLVTIAIIGSAYNFMYGYFRGLTARQIEVTDMRCNSNGDARIIVRNMGTDPLSTSMITVMDAKTGIKIPDADITWSKTGSGIDTESGLAAHYKFDEDDGEVNNVTLDSSGNKNHGVLKTDAVLLMPLDDTFAIGADTYTKDLTWYENKGRLMGDAKIDTDPTRGNVLSLDGTGDYVDVGNPDLSLMANSGTVAAWFRVNAHRDYTGILSKSLPGAGSNPALARLDLYFVPSGANKQLRFYLGDGTGAVTGLTHSTPISAGTWYFGAGTWYYAGPANPDNKLCIYLNDGAPQCTTLNHPFRGNDGSLVIGKTFDYPFNGKIDEVAVFKRALTQAEITRLFNDGKAEFLERVDGKDAGFGKAIEFDGAGDYVRLGDINNFKITDKTISFWAKPSEIFSTIKPIFSSSTGNYYVGFTNGGSGRTIISYVNSAGGPTTASGTNYEVKTNEWHIYTYTFKVDGTNVNVKSYIDSNLKINNPMATGYSITYGANFIIGAFDTGSLFFKGAIDDVRIYSRVLTEEEIKKLAGVAPAVDVAPSGIVTMINKCGLGNRCEYNIVLGGYMKTARVMC